jgi:hypothetical protein
MRHLRWVNEALNLLKQPPSLGRAEIIGRMLRKPFQLEPLTPEQLDWFIEVEKPSQAMGEGVDGMYVSLLTSIDKQPELFPERDRLIHLIKLIIDEGIDHYQRFLAVKKHLAGMEPNSYLRPLQDPQPRSKFTSLQKLSNENYNVLLGALQVSFFLGDRKSASNESNPNIRTQLRDNFLIVSGVFLWLLMTLFFRKNKMKRNLCIASFFRIDYLIEEIKQGLYAFFFAAN